MAEMINDRKIALEKNQLDGSDLLSLMYRSSEQGQCEIHRLFSYLETHRSPASVERVDEAEENATRGVGAGVKLTDEEVMGNTFLFLVAGHEVSPNLLLNFTNSHFKRLHPLS